MRIALLSLLCTLILCAGARGEDAALTLKLGGNEQRFTAAELLARPDAATISVPDDVSYKRAMSYRAVPLLALIGEQPDPAVDTLEAHAADGFVSQVPMALV
jgi:hypothetical protein